LFVDVEVRGATLWSQERNSTASRATWKSSKPRIEVV